VKMVVDRKGKIGEEAGGTKIPDCLQVPEVTDGGVVNNILFVVKVERGVESVGVAEKAQQKNKDNLPFPKDKTGQGSS